MCWIFHDWKRIKSWGIFLMLFGEECRRCGRRRLKHNFMDGPSGSSWELGAEWMKQERLITKPPVLKLVKPGMKEERIK